tara:strand:+ start:505 stop:696 length:192 start_codon:yes stop_codon:yes gene_type:complete
MNTNKDTKENDAKEYAEYLYHHSSDLVGELAFYIYKCWEKDNEWHESDMEYKDMLNEQKNNKE